ncbi:hypothetical protein Bca4012_009494 [Brassica carinata]|uniref:Uncharacterized protein n=1 Tax=Brassica carinata TaxID=52824 RepID=A0A8X7S3V3_BRACI|nr:hypothetical protein Bca52824_034757 [Brassica carinata]
MGSTRECIEEFKINLSKIHDEIREELKKMAQYWEDQGASWSKKMKTWKMEMETTKTPLVTSSCKTSATSPLKRLQARPSPMRHKRRTSRSGKLITHCQSNVSKAGSSFGSQPGEHERLHGSPST